jgi:predicted regulator of Ras-like GTPase activity (Roadblock/LC7/MglB family)
MPLETLRVAVLSRPDGIPVQCIKGSPQECESLAVAGSVAYGSIRALEDVYLKRILRIEAEYGEYYLLVTAVDGDMLLCVLAPKAVPLGKVHLAVRLLEQQLAYDHTKKI